MREKEREVVRQLTRRELPRADAPMGTNYLVTCPTFSPRSDVFRRARDQWRGKIRELGDGPIYIGLSSLLAFTLAVFFVLVAVMRPPRAKRRYPPSAYSEASCVAARNNNMSSIDKLASRRCRETLKRNREREGRIIRNLNSHRGMPPFGSRAGNGCKGGGDGGGHRSSSEGQVVAGSRWRNSNDARAP